jgi:hypothetical protein
MKRNRYISYFEFILLLGGIILTPEKSCPQNIEVHGQISGWMSVHPSNPFEAQFGLRYLPSLSITKPVLKTLSLDMELSANGYGSYHILQKDPSETDGNLKPYRMWLRITSSQFEARIGLQKINFGSASLLRPLMWFDRIDPRDPLQLTDGVYGLLLRYYFLNNTNIWLWGLYGNDETKGWEFIPSEKRIPEFGGRIQLPLFSGEIALSYHHRRADLEKGLLGQLPLGSGSVPENRLGLDGKWDIGIGLWFESTLTHAEIALLPYQYTRLINIGADYTFSAGNGLHVLAEHFMMETSESVFGTGEGYRFSALTLNYPLGLVETLTGMIYYDWENHSWYRFISFQRMSDRWSIYLMGFWNPGRFQIYQNLTETSLFAGKGFQIMLVFNH